MNNHGGRSPNGMATGYMNPRNVATVLVYIWNIFVDASGQSQSLGRAAVKATLNK